MGLAGCEIEDVKEGGVMFDDFFSHGSILAVLLMEYAACAMAEAIRLKSMGRLGYLHAPGLIYHPLATLFMVGAMPCVLWPAIYVGLYSGWIAGLVAWVLLQAIGAAMTLLFGIRGPLLGFHYIAACVAYPVGYYLSIRTLVG